MGNSELFSFYEKELKENILSFWLPRCEDREFGGFVNCYDNKGEHLASYDKYTWSQGRFVWLFSYLSQTKADIFTKAERDNFLRLAKQGAEFLMRHCLLGENDVRCTFLMNRDGSPKRVSPDSPLDMSIFADCFAVLGLGTYASVSLDKTAYDFAKRLYESVLSRVKSGDYNTLPYPLSKRFRSHSIPMILDNTARELLRGAEKLDAAYVPKLLADMEAAAREVLNDFVDENNALREVIYAEGRFLDRVLGEHINPGHTIEDCWFLLDAAKLTRHPEWKEKIGKIALHALEVGWDKDMGGLLHFAGLSGGQPIGSAEGVENETMLKQLSGWGDKLWWVHSEACYTTLRCYTELGDKRFLDWQEKVRAYTFATFPNPDKSIGEWLQIRTRDGSPQEKVVALPVKDPYHIIRNLILILELLA